MSTTFLTEGKAYGEPSIKVYNYFNVVVWAGSPYKYNAFTQ